MDNAQANCNFSLINTCWPCCIGLCSVVSMGRGARVAMPLPKAMLWHVLRMEPHDTMFAGRTSVLPTELHHPVVCFHESG